jgi:hypothetical protein
MQGMFPIKGAILIQLQLFLHISPVFLGGIIFPLTFSTLKRDKLHRRLFSRHNKTPYPAKPENIKNQPRFWLLRALTGGAPPVRLPSQGSAFAPFDSAFT